MSHNHARPWRTSLAWGCSHCTTDAHHSFVSLWIKLNADNKAWIRKRIGYKQTERFRKTERGYVPRYPTAIINLLLNSKALYEIVLIPFCTQISQALSWHETRGFRITGESTAFCAIPKAMQSVDPLSFPKCIISPWNALTTNILQLWNPSPAVKLSTKRLSNY